MSEETHTLGCMEVRGGSRPTDASLRMPGISSWIYSRPHGGAESGGDIHYISSCFTGRVARLALADVSGHGPEASACSELLRQLMKKHVNVLDQSELARRINREFEAQRESFRFATALFLSYFAPQDRLILLNAGHPRPLWHRQGEGWSLLDHEHPACEGEAPGGNMPLGIVAPTTFHQIVVTLAAGDAVVVYSDALIEAPGPDGEPLGEEGLLAHVAALTEGGLTTDDPETFGRALLERVGAPDDDDLTLALLHHDASDVPFRPLREAVRAVAGALGLAGD